MDRTSAGPQAAPTAGPRLCHLGPLDSDPAPRCALAPRNPYPDPPARSRAYPPATGLGLLGLLAACLSGQSVVSQKGGSQGDGTRNPTLAHDSTGPAPMTGFGWLD